MQIEKDYENLIMIYSVTRLLVFFLKKWKPLHFCYSKPCCRNRKVSQPLLFFVESPSIENTNRTHIHDTTIRNLPQVVSMNFYAGGSTFLEEQCE